MGSRVRVSETRLTGIVLSWKGRFGWIRPEKRIQHEESAKHGGRVYVHISDVDGWEELTENAHVSFIAYSDGDGLGAEQVRVEKQVVRAAAYPSGAASVVKTRAVPAVQNRSQQGGPSQPAASQTTSKAAVKDSRAALPSSSKPKLKPHPCLARLKALLPEDTCCPISLTPMEELQVDPFGLLGTTESSQVPKQGIWGEAAEVSLRTNPQQVIHWFDGRFLASFLVSSGQLIDPVNRRELSRGECTSLDEYIAAHGCPAVHVADAFDLANAVKATPQQAEGPAAVRMAALEREAASMLRSLFDFRSVRSERSVEQAVPDPGEEADPPQASEPSPMQWPSLGDSTQGAASRPPAVQPQRRIRACTRRTVHNDGGLQVVDDTEFDEEYEEEDADEPLFGPADPTLAESASAPRRARPARLPRSRADRAQITFSVTGRARLEPVGEGRSGGQAGSLQSRPPTQFEDSEGENSQEESGIPAPLEVEAWIPEWATPDLHERLLSEIEVVSAMFPDECKVLTPDVQEHLQACFSSGRVTRNADPLRVQVTQHVDGPSGGCTVQLEFSLPPFYPLHEPTFTLRAADEGVPAWIRDALHSLQGTLRTELHSLEGSEVMVKAVDWVTKHGPAAFAKARETTSAKAAPSKKQAAPVAPPAVESKAERIEQARRERLSAKFTDKWDLCYAFSKHGSCKDKNCQWRHELPKKDEPKEAKEVKIEAKAKSAGKKKSKA